MFSFNLFSLHTIVSFFKKHINFNIHILVTLIINNIISVYEFDNIFIKTMLLCELVHLQINYTLVIKQ